MVKESPNSNCITFTLDTEKSQFQVAVPRISVPGEPPIYMGNPISPRVLTRAAVEECVLAAISAVFR